MNEGTNELKGELWVPLQESLAAEAQELLLRVMSSEVSTNKLTDAYSNTQTHETAPNKAWYG